MPRSHAEVACRDSEIMSACCQAHTLSVTDATGGLTRVKRCCSAAPRAHTPARSRCAFHRDADAARFTIHQTCLLVTPQVGGQPLEHSTAATASHADGAFLYGREDGTHFFYVLSLPLPSRRRHRRRHHHQQQRRHRENHEEDEEGSAAAAAAAAGGGRTAAAALDTALRRGVEALTESIARAHTAMNAL